MERIGDEELYRRPEERRVLADEGGRLRVELDDDGRGSAVGEEFEGDGARTAEEVEDAAPW
ncbi:MAG: hypothetical protein HY900_32340 [Deltaproteobacteria bacterium]|nr:hypothetical protein [Deltaproteobacteria bacterium]